MLSGHKMKTFTVYRTEARKLKNDFDRENYNESDQPQFEGIEFTDGKVAIRWLTTSRSVSFWDSMEEMKKVHIYAHPDYGTKVIYSDGTTELL